jgi:two-component system heavy metal sensor histidine kinase CusS
MIRSFRFRIALLSTVLAGTALIGFISVAWQLIYVAKVSRLDAKLENQIRRFARPLPKEFWSSVVADIPRELGIATETATAFQVLGAEGEVLYQSPTWKAEFEQPNLPPIATTPPPPPSNSQRHRFPPPEVIPRLITQQTDSGSWRIGVGRFPFRQVAIAVSLETINQEMAAIRNIFGIAIPGTLLLVAGGGWWLSGTALRPIKQLTHAMQHITVAGLDRRVPVGTTDVEFREPIRVFNQMLERLERSFNQASRFSADAAHELKTPLAILQGELEQALQQAESGSPLQQTLGSLLDEVSRLSSIVRKLLLLSLADAGQMKIQQVPVNLSAMLAVMLEDFELLAPDLTVSAEIQPDLQVWGDRDLLSQVLQNLIGNAIKYNLPNGWLHLQARQNAAEVWVTISNASKAIPERDRKQIFDRFYRGDPARTRQVEGIGLGLSLAQEITRAHGGYLTLDPSPGEQTTFSLRLPKQTMA